ncbi:MAG: glycosyltransferase [Promethearchaeota archaeon]
MKVAIFTDTFMPCTNGIVDAVWRISKGLKKAGNTVHIFALSDKNSDEIIEGVIIHKFQGRIFRFYEDYMMRYTVPIRRVFKIAKKVDFDVIHSNSHLSMGLSALILSRLKKIPLISTFHTLLPQYLEIHTDQLKSTYYEKSRALRLAHKSKFLDLLSKISKKLVWWWLSYHNIGTWITTPSNFSKKILINNGIHREKIFVVPNPIDLGIYKKTKKKNEIPLILHVGRLSPEKRVDVLIKALKCVKTDFKCIITSDGSNRSLLQELAIKEGVSNKIKFTGIVSKEKLTKYYHKADIFVSPAIYDTFNNCVAEALSHDTPVIIDKKSGATDFVKHGLNGIIVNSSNPKGYASQIELLLKKNDFKNISSEIKDYTHIDNIVAQFEKVYTKKNYKKQKSFLDTVKYLFSGAFFYSLLALGETGIFLRNIIHLFSLIKRKMKELLILCFKGKVK